MGPHDLDLVLESSVLAHESPFVLERALVSGLLTMAETTGVTTHRGTTPMNRIQPDSPCHTSCKSMSAIIAPLLPFLVHPGQMGLISGRSIAKNFIYAANIVPSCHKRSAPVAVFKLDFWKAFDSIRWEVLDRILLIKGFLELWRHWIKMISLTSQTVVLLRPCLLLLYLWRWEGIILYPAKSPLVLSSFERNNSEISPPIPSHPTFFCLN
jgi:hypothetical protein